jgi:hypothetical protein
MSAPPSRRLFLPVAVVSLSIALAQAPQPSQPPNAEIREIKAIGCVRKATAARCVLLVTLDGETTYSFIAAPKPELDTIVTIQGSPHQGPAVCRQGIQIDVTDWEPAGDRCTE